MKNTAKYYPGSPAVQILGKLHGAANGGYIIQPSPARVSLTLDHGDHLQRWRTYRCDTLAALVEDQLVTVDPTSSDHGQPISHHHRPRTLEHGDVAMTGLSLVWDAGRDLPAAPIEEHAGRTVTWEAWKPTPTTTHIQSVCEQADCLYVGSGWMTVGTVHPLDDDTIERTVRQRTGSGKQYGVVDEAPAYPLRTLFAFACARCHHVTAYEMTGADRFEPVSLDQGVLF